MSLFKDQLIVVTGGCGFIGSCIIGELNRQGYEEIIVVDDLHGTLKFRNLYDKRYKQIISKTKFIEWFRKNADAVSCVFHMGACSCTTESCGNYLMDNNYVYSIDLAKIATQAGVRFVYASSAATYGDGKEGFDDAPDRIYNYKPLNLYGFSKHAFDIWATSEELFSSILGFKFFNVFGPNEYHKKEMRSVIYRFTHQMMLDGRINLFASNDPKIPDGEQMRDFIYVKDVAHILVDCALKSDIYGLFNLGTGLPKSFNDVVKAVQDAMDKPVEVEYIPMPSTLSAAYQNYTCASMQRFEHTYESHFQKRPRFTPFMTAVKDYVQEYILMGDKIW